MKKTTVVINQPCYIPWMGYFERIKRSDVNVILDSVQFQRREWQNRNRIKTRDGQLIWLTVPTKSKGNYLSPIKDIEINYETNWIAEHLGSIRHNYAKAKYFKETFELIENALSQKYSRLVDLNIFLLEAISKQLGIKTKFLVASDLKPEGAKTDLLIDICKKVGGNHYYSALGAKVYMEPDEYKFRDNNISFEYQQYQHPVYPQAGDSFVSHLSIIDLLANVGPDSGKFIDSSIADGVMQ